ncbi:hypothetical protein J6590_024657 [Homalodisca vitripennis]|nr:hypothetical protein J6590_024657 [Homalodisca vitripennis]
MRDGHIALWTLSKLTRDEAASTPLTSHPPLHPSLNRDNNRAVTVLPGLTIKTKARSTLYEVRTTGLTLEHHLADRVKAPKVRVASWRRPISNIDRFIIKEILP